MFVIDNIIICYKGSHPVLELHPTNAEKLQPWFISSNSYFRELDQNNSHVAEPDDDAEVLFKLHESLRL